MTLGKLLSLSISVSRLQNGDTIDTNFLETFGRINALKCIKRLKLPDTSNCLIQSPSPLSFPQQSPHHHLTIHVLLTTTPLLPSSFSPLSSPPSSYVESGKGRFSLSSFPIYHPSSACFSKSSPSLFLTVVPPTHTIPLAWPSG